ncbi:glycosyltransferase family 2 protein [Vibrio sp. TH_r3]|uniref:glycosyltransferase family 2 protein n=1 Tax=Vibrio sp. TH_r3 TaxID=3082084 RepID=UPI002953A8F8|nr:glycosyltransferase family 2 protein [Vibrio sp. TH_r3]MDV7105788.1 glycosyltransferase family 2 protein [Vibrio sp. TH_r3]
MPSKNRMFFNRNSPTLSVVVPLYNEEKVVHQFHLRLNQVIKTLNIKTEVIYVNDGSKDSTAEQIGNLKNLEYSIVLINLSRNFGKEAAMCAGLERVTGDATIIIDADLQDPPELIPTMISAWQEGADVVAMQRSKRHGESWFKKTSALLFYKILNQLADCDIPENVGDFRLLDRKVVIELIQLREKNIYMKGLLAWPGFNHVLLPFERDERFSGDSKWPLKKLIGLAMDGITSFSTKPLQIATYLGSAIAIFAFVYGIGIIFKTLVFGEMVSGFPTIMVAILALGGFQLLSIGLIGSYIGRIYNEVKNRPRFIVASQLQKSALDSEKVVSIIANRKEN